MRLALKSTKEAPKWGNPDRQRVIDELHQQMLSHTASPDPPPHKVASPPECLYRHAQAFFDITVYNKECLGEVFGRA